MFGTVPFGTVPFGSAPDEQEPSGPPVLFLLGQAAETSTALPILLLHTAASDTKASSFPLVQARRKSLATVS